MEAQEFKAITGRLPLGHWNEIERISKKRKMSLNKVIVMLLGVGIEAHKDMESVGLIGIIDLAYYVKEALKQKSAGKQLILPL